ncbi:hypothetical protein MN116_003105 [Schistosoma mekongi]|uniref:Uncharacterized protein n=1 Tax=Schistosoma mekongi TaxID=38744 RepID=A0AAE1ZGE2_SCHME|nr:hypothetical protein MN116_003105 [Schistosoma mekongi]
MVVCRNKKDAHLALNQLSNYRNRLDGEKDGLLVEALNRLMNVFQSRLFLGLLDIQEFYEAILLDPERTKEEKTLAALEIASRWENISSPTLVASTTDLRVPSSLLSKTNGFDRARSMYHINLDDPRKPYSLQPTQLSHHKEQVVDLDKSWKRMESGLKDDCQMSNSLHNVNQISSLENISVDRARNNVGSEFQTKNLMYMHDKSSQKLYDAKLSPNIPVAKPRQKRLKRPKSASTHDSDASLSRKVVESACLNEHSSIRNDAPLCNLVMNDEFNDRQRALLSRLPITMEVVIERSSKGFGFSIVGGHDNTISPDENNMDIYVTHVNRGGPADHESGLQFGDRILSVNGISLIGATHNEAVKALQLAGSRLKLIIERKAELATSEQDSLMSCSSSYSHPKPQMNPIKRIIKLSPTTVQLSSHHASSSNPSLNAQNIESTASTSTGSASGVKSIECGVSATTTSPINGSLFDHIDSKQTLISTTMSTNKLPYKSTSVHVSPSMPGNITELKCRKSNEAQKFSDDFNNISMEINLKGSQTSAGQSNTGSRMSRRGVACAGFPAFSWCSGLQRVTAGCASLGRGHHSLQNSSKGSSQQKLDKIAKSQRSVRSNELGARPTPAPKPGPLVVEVLLTRGTKSGLGFSITGGVGNETINGDSGIFITKLTPGGVAETDGRIRIGDRIVQVNDIPLIDVTHEQAVRVLKQAGDQVRIVLVKHTNNHSSLRTSSTEMKTELSELNSQDVIICNDDFIGNDVCYDNNVEPMGNSKSCSSSISLSSFHQSLSLSHSSTTSHTSPLSEPSIHNSHRIESSSGHLVHSDLSQQQDVNKHPSSIEPLQSKESHHLNHNDRSHNYHRHHPESGKKSHSSIVTTNQKYCSSPDLSNEKCHELQSNELGIGTNNPCFASTGQELLENRMVGIIDYVAAASVSNLINEWPNARLVTLYRSGRKHATTINRNQTENPDMIQRGSSSSSGRSLGLNIVGGDGSEATFISHIQHDKPAGLSKRIFVGDRLLTVNGVDVIKYGHEKAAAALRDARDRVDLLVVYCPEEYADFEKHFCRQLKAVGHKLSYKCLHSMKNVAATETDRDNKDNESPSTTNYQTKKQSESSKEKLRQTTSRHVDKRRQQRKQHHTIESQAESEKEHGESEANAVNKYPNVLLLRCQVDYDPIKENQHQTIPKKVFTLRSGDLVYVINTIDPEWWQAQRFDPEINEPTGPVGLIPSRLRLEKKERTRTLHVNFMSRNSRSMETPSVKSNDTYERRGGRKDKKSVNSANSTHSLLETIGQCRDFNCSKNGTIDSNMAYSSKNKSRSKSSRRRRRNHQHHPLSYISVTPVHLSFARPVVILGYMKDRIADELLCEFPDLFGTAIPYTTRPRRPNEVEGRDYHFVISREIMVADIASQKYLEAGEYNGNLYGTHLDSVYEVSELGLHCLLDVGGPALKRLESAGLPPIAILVLPETIPPPSDKNDDNDECSPFSNEQRKKTEESKLKKCASVESAAFKNLQNKLGRLLQHFTSFLTAIITSDDYETVYSRVKEIIFTNSGPIVWLNSPQPIP